MTGRNGYAALAERARVVVGDISDTNTDYDYGEKQVLELVQFFDALGRPVEHEAAVEGVYRAYENARALWGDKALKWKNATAMKQVGADASRLMQEIRHTREARAASTPSGESSAVYRPGVYEGDKSWWDRLSVPWWAWAAGGAAVLGLVVVPAAAPLIAARLAR